MFDSPGGASPEGGRSLSEAPPRRLGTVAAVLGVVAVAGASFTLWKALSVSDEYAHPAGVQQTVADPVALEAIVTAAQGLLKQGETSRAEAILTKGIAQYPEDQDLRLAYAELLMGSNEREQAYEQYVRALAIGPREPNIEFAAGTLASMVGQYDRAVEHLSMAQAADPHSADYAIHLGQAQLQLDHTLEAKASLLRAAQLDPDRATTWGMLAEIAMRENAAEMAIQHIEKARRLAPSVTAWRVIEARARKRLNDPAGALGVLLEISDAERREPSILKLMSECHGMQREPEKALRLYASAIVRSPENPELLFDGALWAERAGELDQAIDWAQRASTLGHPSASNVAARLKHARGG